MRSGLCGLFHDMSGYMPQGRYIMNGKDLLDKMSDVDPKLITDAEKKPKNKRRLFIGISSGMATVAAAAVLAVAIGRNPTVTPPVIETSGTNSGVVSDTSGNVATSNPENNSGDNPTTSTPTAPVVNDPPVIDFSEYEYLPLISSGDYGVRGAGSSISKGFSTTQSRLEIHSPWSSDMELKTMPVYKSTSTEADMNDLREYVKKAAAALGISESELELSEPMGSIDENLEALRKMMTDAGLSEEEIEHELEWRKRMLLGNSGVEGKADGVSFSTMTDYNLKVSFDPAIKLPDGCKLGRDATDGENLAATEYLAEKFKDLLGYEKPVISKNEERPNYYCVYEDTEKIEDKIFNYSTKYVTFYDCSFPNEDPNAMGFMWISSNENCIKLDDYPIYTAEQAEEILKSNKYSDDERMPADAKILKTDLCYNNLAGFTVVLPYYEFYVESDGTPDTGDDLVCDIYRICAVPDQFIDLQNEDYGVRA